MCTDYNTPREDIQAEKAAHSPSPQGNANSKATTCTSVMGSTSHNKFWEVVKKKWQSILNARRDYHTYNTVQMNRIDL